MLTRGQILEAERIENRHHERIDAAVANRDKSREAFEVWRQICQEWHDSTLPTDYLWSDETQRRMKEGDRETLDDVLLFLEVDPWFFRSGYLKELLLDNLRQAPLTEDDKARIRRALIKIAGGKNRREFSRWCSLAVKVTNDAFERELEEQAKEHDAESSGKFSSLLTYIREHRHDF